MRDKLRTLLGITLGEESRVSMLLTQSVFLGIFLGAFDISAHSMLLSVFDEKIMARGYVLSGIAGLAITFLFYKNQLTVKFKTLAGLSLSVVTVLTLILWRVVAIFPAKITVFILFTLFGPVNIIALLCLRGTANRLLPWRRWKRSHAINDSAMITGIIIISYAIPVLISLNLHTYNLLLAAAISVFATTIIQFMLGSKFRLDGTETIYSASGTEKGNDQFTGFIEDYYVRIIGVYTALSVLATFFIQYSFMAVTRQLYPSAEEMASFLGLFTGSTLILILVLKRLSFEYFLRKYGMRTCILISPVVIAVFTAIAAAIGLFHGINPATPGGLIMFFIFLLSSRLFSRSMKESFEVPALKVICHPLEYNLRPRLKALTGSSFNEILVILSGLILTCLGLLGFFKLLHFTILLFAISLLWLFAGLRLYREHRKYLIDDKEKSVRAGSEKVISNSDNGFKNRLSADLDFRRDYFSLATGNFSGLYKISNTWYYKKIIDYANSNKDINLLPVLKKTAMNNNLEDEIRKNASDAAASLKITANHNADDDKIREALRVLSGLRKPQTTEILRLLRNNSIASKRLAIYMIGKFKLSDLLSEVCNCLHLPGLMTDAYEILKAFGPEAEGQLIRHYVISSGNIGLCRILLRLLGNTSSAETLSFLFSRLWSNSRELKELTVQILIKCKFVPSEEEKQRLQILISDLIGLITWNLSAKVSLEQEHDSFMLDRINNEIYRWTEFLFNILSVTYNPGYITRIREILALETNESVSYAFEMMDLDVSELVKPKLISFFEVASEKNNINSLFQFFPGEIPQHRKLLEDLINRDYNLISLWTKACTLRSIDQIEGVEMTESATALLFSPEEIIQEESARLISRSDTELYFSASVRLPGTISKRLDTIINGTADKKGFLYEKVKFLSTFFSGIPEDELLPLALGMEHLNIIDDESIRRSEGCILWISTSEKEDYDIHVLYSGESEKLIGKFGNGQNVSVYLLPFITVEEYHFQFPEKSEIILKFIDDTEK
jgi:ATP:ADP antiporter, AAA family